jgi:hypothetical protein
MSMALDDAAMQEAFALGWTAEAGNVLCRLMMGLKSLEPAIYVLGPDAGWVSTDELNLLTALRGVKPGALAPAAGVQKDDVPVDTSFDGLLTAAGRLVKDSDVLLASRPFIPDAVDIARIAQQSLREPEEFAALAIRPA